MNIKSLLIVLLLFAAVPGTYAAGIPTFSLSPGDITEASVKMNNDKRATSHLGLEVKLTPIKEAEMTRLTSANLGKKYRFVVIGKLWETPLILDVINSPMMEFSIASPEQGVVIAKRLLKRR